MYMYIVIVLQKTLEQFYLPAQAIPSLLKESLLACIVLIHVYRMIYMSCTCPIPDLLCLENISHVHVHARTHAHTHTHTHTHKYTHVTLSAVISGHHVQVTAVAVVHELVLALSM